MTDLSPSAVALIAFGCSLAGIFLGVLIRYRLPEHHIRDDSKDTLKAATGMIATLVALVIGLLVSSAKNTFDNTASGVTQSGAKIITLDRALSRYGPETKEIREYQKKNVETALNRFWPKDGTKPTLSEVKDSVEIEEVYSRIHALKPKDDVQRDAQSLALQTCNELLQLRWLLIEQANNSVPTVFLLILILWLMVLFTGFGLLTPLNFTSVLALSVCALSMSAAMLLVLEMNHPLEGLIQVSGSPLQKALDVVGR